MMHILITAVNAVAPILLLVLLGYILRRKNFLTENFLSVGNKLVFRILLPCMLFVNVYRVDGLGAIRLDIALYSVGLAVVLFLLGTVTAVLTTKVPQRRGVLVQSFFRSNFAIIGLPLAGALGGDEAVATASVISAFAIPTFNILAVIALTVFLPSQEKKTGNIRRMLSSIAKNPLIISVAAGILALVLRWLQNQLWGETVFSLQRDCKFLYTALDNLKSATTPLALLILGGQFEFSAVSSLKKEIAVGTLGRIVIAPLLGIGLAIGLSAAGWMSVGPNEYPGLVALFASPVAVSSAIMTREMGSDEQLAVQMVVWTSIISVVSIFALVCILMAMGLVAV